MLPLAFSANSKEPNNNAWTVPFLSLLNLEAHFTANAVL